MNFKLSLFLLCVALGSTNCLSNEITYLKATGSERLDVHKINILVHDMYRMAGEENNKNIESVVKNLNALLSERREVKISPALNEYAILIKNILPRLCDSVKKEKSPYLFDEINFSGSMELVVESDLINTKKERKTAIDDSVVLVLMASELACHTELVNKDEVTKVFEENDIQTETVNEVNLSDKDEDSVSKVISKELGISLDDWKKEQEKVNKELAERGYVESENSSLINLDLIFSRYSNKLKKSINDVIGELSCTPVYSINNDNFKLIAVEAVGALTEREFSDLSMIYDSSYGKIQIIESDLTANSGTTFLPSSAFNEKVGIYKAYLLVEKGKEKNESGQDVFQTSIYWNNASQKKEYNVILNKNLNDPSLKKERDSLLKELSVVYGGV